MNVWQGRFPAHNSGEDGYYGTCPVGEFAANALRVAQHVRKRLGMVRGLV